MGFVRNALLVGTLIGVTVGAAYKYRNVLESEVVPRVDYAVEKAGEIKDVFKSDFIKEQIIDKVQSNYRVEKNE